MIISFYQHKKYSLHCSIVKEKDRRGYQKHENNIELNIFSLALNTVVEQKDYSKHNIWPVLHMFEQQNHLAMLKYKTGGPEILLVLQAILQERKKKKHHSMSKGTCPPKQKGRFWLKYWNYSAAK